MERSETVCFYCGVSYLILHEFHQLHARLAQVEADLQEQRETAQREKAQKEALELGRLEWERALFLKVQRQAEEKEKSTREELEQVWFHLKETKHSIKLVAIFYFSVSLIIFATPDLITSYNYPSEWLIHCSIRPIKFYHVCFQWK